MDPANVVNALCIQGMEAEGRGELDLAGSRYREAWDLHRTHIEAAVAAHYLARVQQTTEATLEWNRRALDEAFACDPELVAGLLPSLHLNLGKSHEDVGDRELARKQYLLAEAAGHVLGDDPYGRMLRGGIVAALERTVVIG
ncbi:MAG: hypothetical protein WAM81_00840 [Acidimicrobiia bacterium]